MKRLVFLLSLIFMTSCIKFPDGQTIMEHNKKVFEEYFQTSIDPEQDWNSVDNFSANVIVSHPSDVRVYANCGVYNNLVGNYHLSGNEMVTFDAFKNTKEIYVVNMTSHRGFIGKVGDTFDFSTTKVIENVDEPYVKVYPITDYKFYTASDLDSVIKDNPATEKDAENAIYIANNDFTITPVGWNDWGNITVGIYFTDNEGVYHEQDIFHREDTKTDFVMKNSQGDYWETINDNSSYGTWYADRTKENNYKTKSMHVELEHGVVFGFYIKTNHSGEMIYYSDASKNECGYSSSLFTKHNGKTYLRFDSLIPWDKHDYDSLVFEIDDSNIIPLNNNPQSWILAVEDMGTENDYDFNDVVLKVSHVSGESTAKVWIMAIGGTLNNSLYFNGSYIGNVRDLMGVPSTGFVNVNTMDVEPKQIKDIEVSPDFTLSSVNMGGFVISNMHGSSVVVDVKKGYSPYMICVPENWEWPKEFMNISNAYPKFTKWVGDKEQVTEWYKDCNKNNVVKR